MCGRCVENMLIPTTLLESWVGPKLLILMEFSLSKEYSKMFEMSLFYSSHSSFFSKWGHFLCGKIEKKPSLYFNGNVKLFWWNINSFIIRDIIENNHSSSKSKNQPLDWPYPSWFIHFWFGCLFLSLSLFALFIPW